MGHHVQSIFQHQFSFYTDIRTQILNTGEALIYNSEILSIKTILELTIQIQRY